MKYLRLLFFILVYSFLIAFNSSFCYSQTSGNTIITGSVTDSKTHQPLPFVTIVLENTSTGTVTNLSGIYKIVTIATAYKITFSFVGYETESRIVYPGEAQVINIELTPIAIELNEVVVKPEKRSYSNKNNPAVVLINKVIDNRDRNRMTELESYGCDKYEKIAISLSNIPEDFKQPKMLSQFKPFLDNIDTSRLDGKENIPIYIKETRSDFYFRKDPSAIKEIIRAEKKLSLNEYIDDKGLTSHIKYLYQDIDIYDNEIFFLSNKFLSPVAFTAPVFYRFYIIDTSLVDNYNSIKLYFEPRNKADFLFHGFLYIAADSTYAIKKVDMSFNKKINIDWVNDVRIVQDFNTYKDNKWLISKDDISVDFGVSPKTVGIYGQRSVWYNKYSINEPFPDTLFMGLDKTTILDDSEDSLTYWESNRPAPLSYSEKELYSIVDSIRKSPAFQRRMDIVMLLTTEWLELDKFEIGPIGNFYSFNDIEGQRIRFGGRTTPGLCRKLYLDSYLAYGFKDEQYKYNVGLSYSLSGNSIYKFPVKSIRMSYQYETETPGQGTMYSAKDDILMSFKRGIDDKMLYNRSIRLDYLNEFENHFSYAIGYNYTEQMPAGNLFFTTDESIPFSNTTAFLSISEITLKLRYAPKEEFYQGKLYRGPISSKYPVITLQTALGARSINNDYDYQKIKFNISKRFYFSIVGYTDITAEAGKIFGKVPYPLLFIHDANQTYSYLKNSYNMMNFLEFVSDQYVSLNVDHSFNGFFFNKVPLLKKLKLREVATLKMLYGGVSDQSDPALNPELFRFPTDLSGSPASFSLEQKPYIEASIGASNILRIFRVDLIKRFTYINNPNVSTIGVRVQFRLDI